MIHSLRRKKAMMVMNILSLIFMILFCILLIGYKMVPKSEWDVATVLTLISTAVTHIT